MQHLEHDRLVFLALGESEVGSSDRTHLDACPHCRAELESLRHVAGLGAAGQELRELPDPPEHVWQGIMAEITAAEELPRLAADRQRPDPSEPVRTGPAPVSRRSRRGRLSRLATIAVTAVAAATVGVIGTAAVLRDGTPAEPTVLASAPLAAYGSTPPAARGDARVLGSGELHLHVANLPAVPGYYEVWLINPRNMEMFSVGVLGDGSDVLLPLPPNVDLGRYSVVDVSAEAFDNDTAHSGDSLLRGSLTG
ncbi:anti-sigma factor domain-containing protein [Micromonospora sp. C95]|uniref:anti-sigma factor domain-containing protein n=1 Tax=Micromonospora sp. C95 TaxID=2824882 RepID=UPI001B358D2F|nr:anti-sigma factor [Micromonospora sp. C95]MBQ1028267.1 anti-sigma factor [Micromonospora sp. C95]